MRVSETPPVAGAAAGRAGACSGLDRLRRRWRALRLLRGGLLAAHRRLDVLLHHAAVGAGSRDAREVQPGLLRHAPGQRAGLDAPARGRWRRGRFGGRGGAVAARGDLYGLGRWRRGFGVPASSAAAGSGCGSLWRGRLGAGGAVAAAVLREDVVRALALTPEHGDEAADGHGLAFADDTLQEHAVVVDLQIHRGLVGLDLRDHVAGGDGGALFGEPRDEDTFLHGVAHFGHFDGDSHRSGTV